MNCGHKEHIKIYLDILNQINVPLKPVFSQQLFFVLI